MKSVTLKFHIVLIIVFLALESGLTKAQDLSFIVLGDIHFDKLDYHDWDYVMKRPQDFRQIMNEYPQYTSVYLPAFLSLVRQQSLSVGPPVKAIVQLGDLTEGVAGTPELARAMDRGAADMLYAADMPVPWVLVKGNHDVSNSPGQPEAWREVIEPFIERQINKCTDDGMYTWKPAANTEFFILDQFFSTDRNRSEKEMVDWLENELNHSDAEFIFILTHQPVIPVTERCWHILSGLRRKVDDPGLRDRFLNIIAAHRAVILCAHLHRYSVVSRETQSGTIVQVMVNSVNRRFDAPPPDTIINSYKGSKFVDDNPSFETASTEARRMILDSEKQYVRYFQSADMPGYAVIKVFGDRNEILLSFYNGFSVTPYQNINLSDLQK